MEVDKYLIKNVIQYLKEYHRMMVQHIEHLNDKESDPYKSTAKQIESNGYTGIDKEIENMRVNLMNNSMSLDEIINDLSKKETPEKEECVESCCDIKLKEEEKEEEE
jgi:hypothetical protein